MASFGKRKSDASKGADGGERTERPAGISAIACPLADDKLTKKVLKAVKKAAKARQVKRGVKEVVKALRKNAKGVCVLAGDISPIDVLTHLPVLCEDKGIPYVYVPSKEELGGAGQTKRPTSCILIMQSPPKGGESDEETKEAYKKLHKRVKQIAPVF